MRNADAETGRVTLQCLNGKSTSLFHKLVFPSAQKLQTTSSKRAWWQMTSLPMSIFLNIPELITYLQPLSCQIWGLLVQNFYCSILDLQHIHPTYLFVTAWLHKNERELLLSVSWNHPFLYQIRNTFTVVLWQVIAPSVRHQTSFPPFEASACHKHPFHFAAFLHIVRENSLTIRSETAYISAKLHNPNQIYIYKILTVRTSKSIISTLDSKARSISIAQIATNTLLSWQ